MGYYGRCPLSASRPGRPGQYRLGEECLSEPVLRDEEGPDSNLGMLGEVLGAIGVDNGSITKLGKIKGMYSRSQQGGGLKGAMSQGNGGIQPGYSPGAQVTNERGTWILGQNLQWVLVTPTRPVPMPVLAAAPIGGSPPELPPEPKKA